LAAWLASLPIIASVFHVISPSALLVNLIVGPMTFVILLTAFFSVLSGWLAFPLVAVFNSANHVFCEWLIQLVDWSSHVPFAFRYVPVWPWYFILTWYALLCVWVMCAGWKRAVSGSVLAGLVIFSITHRFWNSGVDVVVIPNGETNVVLIDGPGNHASLIDAGSAYQSWRLADTLRSRGITRLDWVWITRGTSDAYGGLTDLLNLVNVGNVIIPDVPEGRKIFNQHRKVWEKQLGAGHVLSSRTIRDMGVSGTVNVRIMSPDDSEKYRNARDSSMILHISHGHESLLYVSCIDGAREGHLSTQLIDWNADNLVIGKCNAPDSMTTTWLEQISPAKLVFNGKAFDRMPIGYGPLVDRCLAIPGLKAEVLEDEPQTFRL
jgi:competence protein ComEC